MNDFIITQESQKAVFDDILNMKFKIQGLAGFIQNPLEKLLKDGLVTKDEINNSIPEFNDAFESVINELNDLKEKCNAILKHYSK